MPLTRPIPVTTDAAQQRLELELLLKQPVPDPEQLERSLPLLNALNEISPDRWRDLQALPIAVDEQQLDIAIPSQWGESEWQALIDQLPQNGRTIRLHPTLHDDLIRALTAEPSEQPTPSAPGEAPFEARALTTSQPNQNKTESEVSLEDEASSFLDDFKTEGVLETAEDEEAALSANAVDLESSLRDADASPVVALVDRILLQAMSVGASDIHVEPQQKGLRLRYRQDGVLQQYVEPLPSRFGEKVCLRLLDSSATQLGLDKLISNPTTLELVRDLGAKPFGMILVTGPTGSGKSTTLYSLLAERNDPGINISTVEDPIE